MWYENIRDELQLMGYTCTELDNAVFVQTQDSILFIITLYIDDITMALQSAKAIKWDKEALKVSYKMMDLGNLSWILSMHIVCKSEQGWITLS